MRTSTVTRWEAFTLISPQEGLEVANGFNTVAEFRDFDISPQLADQVTNSPPEVTTTTPEVTTTNQGKIKILDRSNVSVQCTKL